ncbi:hypothetical protein IJM16_04795 [Candidatus Saccharibacteria bacterium]|nr:hypothetical protein [Candidatus Saccharibacteria bacterium]
MDIILFIVGTIVIAVGSVGICMKALKGGKKIPKSCDMGYSIVNKVVTRAPTNDPKPLIDPESLIDPFQ